MFSGSRREDDWVCPSCKNVNFAFRTTCNMRNCNQSRPADHTVHNGFTSHYSCCRWFACQLCGACLRVLPLVACPFAFTSCCCCLPFRRPCRSLCRPRLTIPHQGATWAQGRHRRCTLVGVLPHMAPQCLTGLQCRAMVSRSSLGVLRIHMDMVVAYQWGAPTGQFKWPGQLHTLVDL